MTGRLNLRSVGRPSGRPGSSSGSDSNASKSSFRKRKEWSRLGVSEIIGNLLILAITVTLFTGILYFVSSMPGPQEKVYTDFVASTPVVDNVTHTALVTITHKGGDSLADYKTNIYLFQDNTPRTLKISNSLTPILNNLWTPGSTWTYLVTGVYSNTTLSIMVVDTEANTVVYTGNLIGGQQAAMTYPIIGDRGLTPSPVYDGTSVQFYAQISDPYGNLDKDSVYVNATSLGITTAIKLDYNATLNEFISSKYTAALKWTGATVLITASDTNGHKSTASLVLTVLVNPAGGYGPYANYLDYLTNGTFPPDVSGGSSGGSTGITFYYIRRTSDGAITRDFNVSEGITIEVWSDTLVNVASQNSFYVFQPLLGVNPIFPPSSNMAFQSGQTFSTFRQFVFNFTAPSDPYRYPVQILMKDNRGITVNIADNLNVSGPSYPQLQTYVLQGNNLVKTTVFNHTDDVYLLIRTKDVDTYTNTVYLSGIEIDDYSGSYVVMKSPPAVPAAGAQVAYSAPLSSLFKTNGITGTAMGNASAGSNTATAGIYTMKIVLKDANQGWWLPKTNFYTLKIGVFFDTGTGGTTGESYSLLSCQFAVTAPLSTTDVAAAIGSGSFSWSASGATWSNNAIAWFKGGDQWNEKVIDSSPSSGPLGLSLQDLTGDGRNDLVVGAQDSSLSNLFWYESEKSDGSDWSSARPISYPFDALATPQTAYDTDKGNDNEDSSVWSTAVSTNRFYSGYYSLNEMCTALAVADLNRDGRADVVASFIHVVVFTSATGSGDADYTNSYGMFFNRGVYVFWNDGTSNWQRTTLYGTDSWIANDAANKDSNPACTDLAIADFNLDGYLDVVGVYETGDTNVWINQWIKQAGSLTGAFGTSDSLRTPPDVTGNMPWAHTQITPKVRAADMNGDGYPDIIRTSTLASDRSVYVFYTQRVSAAVPQDYPSAEYPMDVNYTATKVGPLSNLATVNNLFETLTEKNVLYPAYDSTGSKLLDDTGSDITRTYYNDSQYYDVPQNSRMRLYNFLLPAENISATISKTSLVVKYNVESGYNGNTFLEYSFDGGSTWTSTGIQPTGAQTADQWATFDLTSVGGSSYTNIVNNLQIRFINSAGSAKAVHFDYVWVEVTFIQTKAVGWVYQIPNAAAAYQVLTAVGKVSGSEGFHIEYSPDNATWFDLGDFTSTTLTTLNFNLTYTPNSVYYIRITDLNRAVTDNVLDTLSLDQLVVSHNSPTVEWTVAPTKVWTSSSGYISALAVGDMKKRLGVYVPNEPNDVVVATGGATTADRTLFIIQQSPYGTYNTKAVSTPNLAIMCPSSGNYEVHGVELGDLDGDQDLDIILVVGAVIGRTMGAGPTLWEYTNNQQQSTYWQFVEIPISSLAARGEAVINITTGYIDLSIMAPILGIVVIVGSSQAVNRLRRVKK